MADRRRRKGALGRAFVVTLVMCLMVASCGSQGLPRGEPQQASTSEPDPLEPVASDPVEAAEPDPDTTVDSDQVETSPAATPKDGIVTVDATGPGIPIDPRLLGTNLPAWIGPDIMADEDFQSRALESGTTLVRMPGGSWSNGYDWLGCEQGDSETCFWTWAARPTDFIDFLKATGLEGMWTVSINETAQKAAAAVAFFNGDVADSTKIGVDRIGEDWGRVSDWAQLRAAGGNPDPVGISLWEVGNEVYGGKPSAGGGDCASFGWEDVWTCDGTEYVEGDDANDGAFAIRAAMLAVDPDIEVGFVGVDNPDSWSNWGNEVIDAAGESLDMYAVHYYGFDESPNPEDALRSAGESWPTVIAEARRNLPPGTPLALTEYNLVAVESQDTSQTMTRAMNAFFLADSIGELAEGQVEIANWWNLGNGVAESGTDYGLISVADNDYRRSPAFDALAMWGRTGPTLLDGGTEIDDLRVYPTRHDDGRLTVLVLNLDTERVAVDLVIDGLDPAGEFTTTLEAFSTDDLAAQELVMTPAVELGSPTAPIDLEMAGWSMNVIEVVPSVPDTAAAAFSVEGDWVDVTSDLVGLESSCGNVSYVSAHPDTDQVLVNVSTQGLFSLAPESDGWTQLGVAGPLVNHRTQWIEFDPEDSDRYWVSGAYGDGVFETDDGGTSFRTLGDVYHVDRVAVDLSDPERQTMLAGIHEESDLMLSLDGGRSWENLRDGLPEDVGFSSTPLILGSTFFVGSYDGADSGIYRSDDGGETWDRVYDHAVLGAPVVTDDFIAWSIDSDLGGLAVSVDGGVSFKTAGGFPGLQNRTLVDLGEDGLATAAKTGLVVTTDLGESWTPIGPDLSFEPSGVAYSASRSAFYAWIFTCEFGLDGNPVLPGSIMQLSVEAAS